MERIEITVSLSREILDSVIDSLVEKDQNPLELHKKISEQYGISDFDIDTILAFLEKERILETDIYGVKGEEPPKYYEMYSANKVFSGNRQELVEKMMAEDKILECDQNKELTEAIMTALANRRYSFKEIQNEVSHRIGKTTDWAVLMIHLLELKKEHKIHTGFVEREGHYAQYYAIGLK